MKKKHIVIALIAVICLIMTVILVVMKYRNDKTEIGTDTSTEESSSEVVDTIRKPVKNQFRDLVEKDRDEVTQLKIREGYMQWESYDMISVGTSTVYETNDKAEIEAIYALFNDWYIEENLVPKEERPRSTGIDGTQVIDVIFNDRPFYGIKDICRVDKTRCCGIFDSKCYYLPDEFVKYIESLGVVFQKWTMKNQLCEEMELEIGSLTTISMFYSENGITSFLLEGTETEYLFSTAINKCVQNLITFFAGWDMEANKVPEDEILDIKQKYYFSFNDTDYTISYGQKVNGKYYGAINDVPYYLPEEFAVFLEESDNYFMDLYNR